MEMDEDLTAEGTDYMLAKENAELRELVQGLCYCIANSGTCARIDPCGSGGEYTERCPLYGDDGSHGCKRLMQELEIEVSE